MKENDFVLESSANEKSNLIIATLLSEYDDSVKIEIEDLLDKDISNFKINGKNLMEPVRSQMTNTTVRLIWQVMLGQSKQI